MAYDKRLNMRQNFEAGKGSRRRPTNEAAYRESWDRVFGDDVEGSEPTSPEAREAILKSVEEETYGHTPDPEEAKDVPKTAAPKGTPYRKRGDPFPWEKRH